MNNSAGEEDHLNELKKLKDKSQHEYLNTLMNTFKVEMRAEMKKLAKISGQGGHSSGSDAQVENVSQTSRLGNPIVEFSTQVQKMENKVKSLQN